jgi:flagellar assembly protein FliH
MSKEWSRHSFRPVAAAETAVELDTAPVSGPVGFSKQEPVTWRNADGFVRKGEGFAPASGFAVARKRTTVASPADFVPSNAFGGSPPPAGNDDAADVPTVEGDVIVEATEANAHAQAVAGAYAAGFAEGERTAHAAMSAETASCARLIVALTGTTRFDRASLAQRLQQTVLHLTRQLVGELGVAPERLAQRVDDAVAMLADVTEPARVTLHPDDLKLIAEHLPPHVAAVANPQIERGGFRLETMSATVEDGPTLWMEQLSTALDRVSLTD